MIGEDPSACALVLVRPLDAPAELIFQACSDPKWLVRWLAPGAGSIRSAILNVTPGGSFQLEGVNPDGAAYEISGRYLDIVPGRRIETTWCHRGSAAGLNGPPSRVRFEIRPLGPDRCELTLTHSELDGEEAAALHRTVWTICLDRLAWSLAPAPDEPNFRPPLGALAELYGEQHRLLQNAFDSRRIASALRKRAVTASLTPEHQAFIAARDMVFLTTIDHRGFPTCSYKGGAPGFVRVLDDDTLAIPSYDGNGMFLSAGNIAANCKVGLLFIDFETPHRLRLHGTARLIRDEARLAEFPGAELLLMVKVYEAFINCPRYIHRYRRIETSAFVPGEARGDEVAPWKTLEGLRDQLPARDRQKLAVAGEEPISPEEYLERVKRGTT